MAKFLKKHLTTIILYTLLLVGICLLLYPTVSDRWNSFHQTRAIATYVEAVDAMNGETMEAMLEDARRYNGRLAVQGARFQLTEEEKAEYESLLDVSGTGVMGYLQIPKINVSLPVYHGTDEAILRYCHPVFQYYRRLARRASFQKTLAGNILNRECQ